MIEARPEHDVYHRLALSYDPWICLWVWFQCYDYELDGIWCHCSFGEMILFLPHLVLFCWFDNGGVVLDSDWMLLRSGYSELALTLTYFLVQVAKVPGNGHTRLGGGSCSGNPWLGLDSANSKMTLPCFRFWFLWNPRLMPGGSYRVSYVNTLYNLFWIRVHCISCMPWTV